MTTEPTTVADTAVRLERRQAGTVYVHGELAFASGFQSSLSLPHTEWEALETALNRDGICGDEAPTLIGCTSMPVVCQLRYNHGSEWHEGEDGSRWRALPGVEAQRTAVVEAARAWRAGLAVVSDTGADKRANDELRTKNRIALQDAVDALGGAS